MGFREVIRQIERSGKIFCPHCDCQFEDNDPPRCISYWGSCESGPVTVECEHCGQEFLVTERVSRTYETKPIGGGAGQ